VDVDGREYVLSVAEVKEVRVQGDRRWRRGMLIGGLGGAAVGGALVLLRANTREERGWAIVGAAAGGSYGLGLGALFGTFTFERPVVYDASRPQVSFAPLPSSKGLGLRAVVTF
jgi:hypothetical protein